MPRRSQLGTVLIRRPVDWSVIDQDGRRPYLPIPGFFAVLRHVAAEPRER
jgi:hypothetical protein